MGPNDRKDELNDAGSPEWNVRAAAGRCLAADAQDPGVADMLHRLLLDGLDTFVTRETAEALLERGDPTGLRLVLAALGSTEDVGTADHLDDAITNIFRQSIQDIARLRELCSMLATDPDEAVREEATAILNERRTSGR